MHSDCERTNHCNRFSAKTTCRKCNIAFFKFDGKMARWSDLLTFLTSKIELKWYPDKSKWYPDKPEPPCNSLRWRLRTICSIKLSLRNQTASSLSLAVPPTVQLHLSDWVRDSADNEKKKSIASLKLSFSPVGAAIPITSPRHRANSVSRSKVMGFSSAQPTRPLTANYVARQGDGFCKCSTHRS